MLAFIVIGTGAVFVIIFHVGTKETSADLDSDRLNTSIRTRMRVSSWLRTPQFYIVSNSMRILFAAPYP